MLGTSAARTCVQSQFVSSGLLSFGVAGKRVGSGRDSCCQCVLALALHGVQRKTKGKGEQGRRRERMDRVNGNGDEAETLTPASP
jgi:hypothetical protein